MQRLCIMVMIYVLHHSFLARGKHLHCIRRCLHAAAQMWRRKMLTTPKITVGPQMHLVELERKAEDNKQIPCFIYSFVSMTLNPSEDKLPEWKASSLNLSFKVYFLSSILTAVWIDCAQHVTFPSCENKIVLFPSTWKACNHLLNHFPCCWINRTVSNCSIHCTDEQ